MPLVCKLDQLKSVHRINRIVAGRGPDLHIAAAVAVISRSAKPGIQFNGLDRDGRVNGQMDVAAASAICPSTAQGVLLPRKLSLDSQGQIANEVVRGSFTFLR